MTNGDLGNGSRRNDSRAGQRRDADVECARSSLDAPGGRARVVPCYAGSDNLDLILRPVGEQGPSTPDRLKVDGTAAGGQVREEERVNGDPAKSSHSLDLPRGRVNDPQLPHPRRLPRSLSRSFLPPLSLSLFPSRSFLPSLFLRLPIFLFPSLFRSLACSISLYCTPAIDYSLLLPHLRGYDKQFPTIPLAVVARH